MPQEIYNEGRVVGLSAWELYKRQALSNGVPEPEIPNEREWLASMIGAGASMVLKITDANRGFVAGVHEYELPANSNLTGAGVIVATPFMGDCEFSDTAGSALWAKKIISYGSLIENDATKSPTSSDVPVGTSINSYKECVSEFLKITDGIVYTKQANWIERSENRTESFSGDAEQVAFPLTTTESVLGLTSVTINNVAVNPNEYSYNADTKTITFSTAPADNASIVIKYNVINTEPAKDIDPNFNNSSTVVRLQFASDLKHEVSILLTGFTNKRILQALSGYAHNVDGYAIGGSTDTENNDWVNGGLLGPEIIPWASKIVFMVTSSSYTFANDLDRRIPYGDAYPLPSSTLDIDGIHFYGELANGSVKSGTVVDFNSINLTDYYSKHSSASTLGEYINSANFGINDNISNLVAWYPGMTGEKIKAAQDAASSANFFPPALYAAKISETNARNEVQLIPLDTAAPGTVKGFSNPTDAANYAALMTENYALYYNPQTNSYSFVVPGLPQSDWPGAAKISYLTAPKASITTGSASAKFIALNNASGEDYGTTGAEGDIVVGPANKLNWSTLLQALPANYAIDVLGNKLRALGMELESDSTIGKSPANIVAEVATNKVTVTGDYPVSITTSQNSEDSTTNLATLNSNSAYKSGTEFIEFSNGLRLYISNTPGGPDPTNVPLGSIGIGWIGDSVIEEVTSENPPTEESDSRPAMGG